MKLDLLPEMRLFHLFALESEKESRKDERRLFWGYTRSLDLSPNP